MGAYRDDSKYSKKASVPVCPRIENSGFRGVGPTFAAQEIIAGQALGKSMISY